MRGDGSLSWLLCPHCFVTRGLRQDSRVPFGGGENEIHFAAVKRSSWGEFIGSARGGVGKVPTAVDDVERFEAGTPTLL